MECNHDNCPLGSVLRNRPRPDASQGANSNFCCCVMLLRFLTAEPMDPTSLLEECRELFEKYYPNEMSV